jgi:hypothetical protein
VDLKCHMSEHFQNLLIVSSKDLMPTIAKDKFFRLR